MVNTNACEITIGNNWNNFFDFLFKTKLCLYAHRRDEIDQLITSFDIDATQFTFNGETLQGTMAAIEAIRTSTIINYALNNDDKDYARIAIRIGKYVKHGFKLLAPVRFNFKRFQVSPTHISNRNISLNISQYNPNQDQSYLESSVQEYNNAIDYEYPYIVFSRNYDCFYIQNNFRLKMIFANQ
ncbi:unnamed protein product [Rotaria sordida]|uniref:Uncharacterized protein n=1 Tax=Rotaria sordida TaxID=392033 RepID=A0A814YN19_9BILA|nr:unnamed protein product [Rotaria sordida]